MQRGLCRWRERKREREREREGEKEKERETGMGSRGDRKTVSMETRKEPL